MLLHVLLTRKTLPHSGHVSRHTLTVNQREAQSLMAVDSQHDHSMGSSLDSQLNHKAVISMRYQ